MKILKWFSKKHKRKIKFRYCEFNMINWPQERDIVEREMESGKIGVFKIENIDRPSDPGDQFFYDEVFLGYRYDDTNLPIATRRPYGFRLGGGDDDETL